MCMLLILTFISPCSKYGSKVEETQRTMFDSQKVSTIFNSEFDFVTPEAFMTQSMTANK